MKSIILVATLYLASISGALSKQYFDNSLTELLSRFNQNQNTELAAQTLVRCSALLTLTNMVLQQAQNPSINRIEPEALVVGAVKIRTGNTTNESNIATATTETIGDFKSNSKTYQTWFIEEAKNGQNPFLEGSLLAEFQLCNEVYNRFTGQL